MATRGTALATGGVPADKDIVAAEKTYAPLMEAGKEALGKIRTAEEGIATAEGDIAKAKYEQEKTRLAATQKAEEEYAGKARGLYEKAETELEKYPFPTFKPTQEDATSYAQLGSMVITLGMMLGGGAKASGKSALASMTGMVNGWREGRQDLWRREAQQFDKDMQRIKSEREAIQKNLEKGLKLAATDRKTAQASIDAAAHLAGEGVVKEMLKKGQLIPALNYMKQSAALEQKINESIIGMAAAERRNRQQLAAQEAQRQATLQAKGGTDDLKRQLAEARIKEINARIDRANKKSEDAGKNDKPPAKEIVNANKLRNNLLPKLETAIPVLDRLHQEGRWGTLTTLLAFDPRAAELAFKNDPEAINLILSLAYFRSKEFEDAGKALTRKEDQILAPIVRGDLRVYEGIRNALVEGQKTLALEQKQLENAYPYIKKVNESFRKEISSGYEVGKIYTDAQGNKAKYLGPGQWEEQ